jgi:hypothetical protein
MLTIEQIEKATGEDARDWAGFCYAIACAIVEKGLVDGIAVYGHWLGPINEKSNFAHMRNLGFCRHGWVVRGDGTIVDPTRWVFEAVEPYVYEGPSNGLYDEGWNELRRTMCGYCPDPDQSSKVFELKLSLDAARVVTNLTMRDRGLVDVKQLSWLANVPYDMLMPYTAEIFLAIEKVAPAFVPIDNRRRAERELGINKKGKRLKGGDV